MKANRLFVFFILFLITSFIIHPDKKFTDIKDGTIINLYDAFSKDSTLTKDFGFSCITKYQGKTYKTDYLYAGLGSTISY